MIPVEVIKKLRAEVGYQTNIILQQNEIILLLSDILDTKDLRALLDNLQNLLLSSIFELTDLTNNLAIRKPSYYHLKT